MKSLTQFIYENIESSSLFESSQQKPNGFIILKPGFTEYEEEFRRLLKLNDWKILNSKTLRLSRKQAEELYESHKDKAFYQTLCDYMSSGDCICMTVYKKCMDPIKDMNIFKDKIRADWGKDDMKNAMHSSDSLENVERESKICMKGK